MRRHKISLDKVQTAFNNAIKRRDYKCIVQDLKTPCSGQLECSHFFGVGSNPALRFYPPNAYAQCSHHHLMHHTGKEPFYENYIKFWHINEWNKMERMRHRYIKYTDELKTEIIRLCNEDKLWELRMLIEKELGE